MELIEKILSEENLQKAIRKVKKNKGAPGVDKMTVQEVEEWFNQYKEDLISKILNKQYKPMPVKRVKSMSQYLVTTVMALDQIVVHIWRWKKCLVI